MNRTRQLVLILFRDLLGRFVRLPRVVRISQRTKVAPRCRPIAAVPTAVQLALF
jgi:hypothetical protein